ncbi:MAG TPA: NAD(P)H-hydrate dehydratase [Bacteroidales bacterium]|nr:NAD(P)H-hydrate dehydratase [Bacteroidales bacterium]HRZ48125.1 NAD(P)H-hydrate dehydratase [Bacteroidales bacterium]
MKILPISLVREADAYTIAHEPVASVDLMERAGMACVEVIAREVDPDTPVVVVSGQGNNGGDGLVIARHLNTLCYSVQVYVLKLQEKGSPDFEINLKHCSEAGIPVAFMASEQETPVFQKHVVIIDALFGSGLSRPVTGRAAGLISAMNRSGCTIIAIDIPSGLFADAFTDEAAGAIVKASLTLSLELPKLAMMMPGNFRYTGPVGVVPIGLDAGFIGCASTPWTLFANEEAASLFRPRSRVVHKGHFGHGLLLAGSRERGGAALMSAKAALRSGAGLLTAHIPGCLASAMNIALPEAMLSFGTNESRILEIPDISGFSAIAAGPGLGTRTETAAALRSLLQSNARPLVLDADALNILASNPEWLKMLPPDTILTPHPKEFERLAGTCRNDFERLQKAVEFASECKCYLVLKSAFTVVIDPEGQCSFNLTGNAGLAKGGSGDTLTGIILGLLCRGYTPWDAARLGVFIHGRAAELAAQTIGLDAMLASDVAGWIGQVFKELEIRN